jgi:RHH-type proline utilization regulon transcriptional repressor/proline dehydrogenase/delta 1-pyrroline-5-carboxylate dehydrogenase
MGDPLKTALVKMNQRLRVYCPMGAWVPGVAYLVRRLLENTANDSFLRQSFLENADEDQLLAKPTG